MAAQLASPHLYITSEVGGLGTGGSFGISLADPSADLYRRQVLRQCPASFKCQALPPAKQGTWHYGCRVIPTLGCLTKSGKRFPTYEIWRRWEDCLDLQRTLEKEFERLSNERKKKVKAQKQAGLYPSERAASFDSLPSGLDPSAIQTDIHAHLPKLTRKASLFRPSATVIEQRGEEFIAFITALFALETDLIEDVLNQAIVRDWFGWWRRDRESAKKIAAKNGGEASPAIYRDNDSIRSNSTLSFGSPPVESSALTPPFSQNKRPHSAQPTNVKSSTLFSSTGPGSYAHSSPMSAPPSQPSFLRSSEDSMDFSDAIDTFPTPPPSRRGEQPWLRTQPTQSPNSPIAPTPFARAVQYRENNTPRPATADSQPQPTATHLFTPGRNARGQEHLTRPLTADDVPTIRATAPSSPSPHIATLQSTIASLSPSVPPPKKKEKEKAHSVKSSISNPIPLQMSNILDIDDYNLPSSPHTPIPRTPRTPIDPNRRISNMANRNARIWTDTPLPLSPSVSSFASNRNSIDLRSSVQSSNSSTPTPVPPPRSPARPTSPLIRFPPSANATRNPRVRRFSAGSGYSFESVSDVELPYYRNSRHSSNPPERLSRSTNQTTSSSSGVRNSISSFDSSFGTDSSSRSPSTRHTSLRRSLSFGSSSKRKTALLGPNRPIVFDEDLEFEIIASANDSEELIDSYFQRSSRHTSFGGRFPEDLLRRAETAMSALAVRNSLASTIAPEETWTTTPSTSSHESLPSSSSATVPTTAIMTQGNGDLNQFTRGMPGYHLPLRIHGSNSSLAASPYASPTIEHGEFRFDFPTSTTSNTNSNAIVTGSPTSGPDTVTVKVVYPPTDGIVSFRIRRSILLPDLCDKIASKFRETEGVTLQWGEGHWGLAYLLSSISGSVQASPASRPSTAGGAFSPLSESTNSRRQSFVGRSRSNSVASITSGNGDLSTLTLIVTRSDWEDLTKRCGDRLSLRITEWVVPL